MTRLVLRLALVLALFGVSCTPDDEYSAKYLPILRQYADYANEDVAGLPVDFTYQRSSDEQLAALRATYNLEQIAGSGDEVTKLINLMTWVNKTVRHNGNAANPEPRNALNILQRAQAVNCRMVSTVLNEVYLSMGFYSRMVSCLPVEEQPTDIHVINSVYSTTLQKWIYVDASFNALFRDEKENLLDIQEVRARRIDGDPLLLNDDINHNGEYLSKDWYLGYMTKNLFRFSCPASSEFNGESNGTPRAYIDLNPKGYHSGQEPAKSGIVTTYFVSNPAFYWSLPAN